MTHRFTIMYPLPDGEEEERIAYICLPDSYFENKHKRYPVVYMFDGHNVYFDEDATFGKSWGMDEYMEIHQPQVIIAAVECNHNPDNGRMEEYSPYTFFDPKFGAVFGRGHDTMDWFVYEFKRQVDESFRTLPDRKHTFIAGSSMGGLMSLYALMEYNSVFSRAAALSPSLWTSPRDLHRIISHADLDPDTTLYINYGSEEFCNHQNQRRAYREIVGHLRRRGVDVHSHIVQGGTHCEACWQEQIPYFMRTLLRRRKW